VIFNIDDNDSQWTWVNSEDLHNFEKEFAFSTRDNVQMVDEYDKENALLTYEGLFLSEFALIVFTVDCAATQHFINDIRMFINIRLREIPLIVSVANSDPGTDITIKYEGDVILYNQDTNQFV